MVNRSTTMTGAIVSVVGMLFVLVGIPIGEGEMMEIVDNVIKLSGLLTVFISQIVVAIDRHKKNNVSWTGKRKLKENTDIPDGDPV